MATTHKAPKPATQPVAQPAPVVQNPTESTPLVFIRGGRVIAVLSEADALAQSQAEAKARREVYLESQRKMRKQPKHIQSLGRTLWNLWD